MTTPTREQVVQWDEREISLWLEMGSPESFKKVTVCEIVQTLNYFKNTARADLEASVEFANQQYQDLGVQSNKEIERLEAIIAEQAAKIELLKTFWSIEGANVDRLRQQNAELTAQLVQQSVDAANEFDAHHESMLREIDELTAQRDELLLALENIAACPGDNRLTTAIQWAKAAIINHKEQDENRSE